MLDLEGEGGGGGGVAEPRFNLIGQQEDVDFLSYSLVETSPGLP